MYLEIFLVDFAVFRGFLGISQVRDHAKYQKPCQGVLKFYENSFFVWSALFSLPTFYPAE